MATILYHWEDEVLDGEALDLRISEAFEKIEARVDEIEAIAWDGCHKVYLALDHAEAERFLRLGYGPYAYGDEDSGENRSEFLWTSTLSVSEILDVLQQWYFESCGLQFISAVKGGEFEQIIPQVFTSEAGE